jgi:hypothetical protein
LHCIRLSAVAKIGKNRAKWGAEFSEFTELPELVDALGVRFSAGNFLASLFSVERCATLHAHLSTKPQLPPKKTMIQDIVA